jgi:phage recombination protein Bet
MQDKSKDNTGTAMTVAEIKQPKNAIEKLAARLDLSNEVLQDCLQKTAFSLCKEPAQFVAACVVANTYGLNPLLKEMYAFPGKSGGVVPVVSIDGWIKLVNRQEDFNGVEIIENKEAQDNKSGTNVESVTVKFYMKHREHPTVVTEYMAECFDGTKEPWKRWPRRMLRHKAYIQGARLAFGFGGIYDEDEASRIHEAEVITDPVIGLKHDKTQAGRGKVATPPTIEAPAASVGQPATPEAALAQEVGQPVVSWHEVGDVSRFGKQANSAALMLPQIEKIAVTLGKEKFIEILGANGIERLDQILSVQVLAKVMDEMYLAIKVKEETNA